MTVVRLSWQELMVAAQCGVMRQVKSLQSGRKDAHGYDGSDGWTKHIDGACGEIAVAKALGVYWQPTVDTFKAADIGASIQVRTRARDDYDLIVRPADDPQSLYVLVTGRAPTFTVHGYIEGHAARRPEWLKTHGDRPEAWFVPKAALLPLEALHG